MHGGGSRGSKLIGVGQAIPRLVDKGPVRKNEFGGAASDCTGRCAPREGLEDGAHLRRGGQSCLLDGRRGYEHAGRGTSVLPQAFIVQEEEDFVLNDMSPDTHSVLAVSKRRDSGIPVDIEVIEVARIENGIPQITKY